MPIRSCRGCRRRREVHEFVRLAVGDAHLVVAGWAGIHDKPGRGLYTCPSLACARRTIRAGRGGSRGATPALAEELFATVRSQASAWLAHRMSGLRRRRIALVDDRKVGAVRALLEQLDVAQAAAESGAQGTRETRP